MEGKISIQKGERTTWGFAILGQKQYSSALVRYLAAVRAEVFQCSFLFLSSSSVFQLGSGSGRKNFKTPNIAKPCSLGAILLDTVMNRNFTLHIDKCNSFLDDLRNDKPFKSISADSIEEYGFDIEPISELELSENYPNCCEYHKTLKQNIESWFDNFPNCCEEHRKISLRQWFKKEKYNNVPNKVFNHLTYTEHFISKNIDSENWYEEITDYIEYNLHSFGTPNVGASYYWSNLKHYIKNADIKKTSLTKDRRNRLIEYFDTEEKSKKDESNQKDLNLLFSTFQKWQRTFPNLHFFQTLKQQLNNKFPLEIVLYEPKYNKYLGLTKFKIKTQTELIEILVSITKNLLSSIDTTELTKNYHLKDKEKLELDLISANHKIKQDELLKEFSSTEIKYLTIIKKWLKNETNYFKQLQTKLPAMIVNTEKATVYNNENGNQVITNGNSNNIVLGNNNDIELSMEKICSIKDTLNSLRQELVKVQNENKNHIENEIERVLTHLQDQKPKSTIIKSGLNLIYDLLIEVTGAGISPIILTQLAQWIK